MSGQRNSRRAARALIGMLMLLLNAGLAAQSSDAAHNGSGLEGLHQIKIKGIDVAYALPGATLAGYTKVLIEPTRLAET